MKIFKRLIVPAVCAVIAVVSLSGCNLIFGSSNRCLHDGVFTRKIDETSHYKICGTCGATYDREKHFSEFRYDDSEHFNYCVICGYKYGVQAHALTEWKLDSSRSTRKCTAQYCQYTESCEHPDRHYIITDAEHYPVCDYCEYLFTRKKEEHKYNAYTAVNETAHKTSCVCGKPDGELKPHFLQYESENYTHWQYCICGFETEKTACTYGAYLFTEYAHYKICSVCGLQSEGETHSLRLLYGERGCKTCEYVKHPYKGLLGTWRYTVGMTDYLLVLSSNWSYTIKQRVSGAVEKQGKYDMFIEENSNGTVTGRIDFMLDGELNESSMSVKFDSGETDKFFSGGLKYVKI